MAEKRTKKVYGKVTRTPENTIIIDQVFGGKLECSIDASMYDEIPDTEENINIIITDEQQPEVIQFLVSKKEEAPTDKVVELPTQEKELAGKILHVRGRIISSELSDVGGGKVGTLILQLPHMKLRLLYGKKSEGEVPSDSTMVTAEIYDGKLPKIKSISSQTDNPPFVPNYVKIPEEGGFRWPLVCMECGNNDITQLSARPDSWSKIIDVKEPDWGQTIKDFSLGMLVGGLPKAIGKLRESGAHRFRTYYVNMDIKKILCNDCRKKNKKYENLLDIEVYPRPGTFPVYEIKFRNKEYENAFRFFNDEPYYAEIQAR